MAIQQRDTTATAAQIDVDNLRDELRASKESVSFMRSEILASSSHRKDLHDRLSHTRIVPLSRNVIASLPMGQAHVEPITSSLPTAE